MRQHASYHGRVAQKGDADCAQCHTEHYGENFRIYKWETSKEEFDHRQTGYPLTGRHAGLRCEQCHNARHVPAEDRKQIRVHDLNQTFEGLHTACLSCHEEHKFKITEIAPVCAKCHGEMFPSASMGMTVEKVPHNGPCKSCHTLHGSPGVAKSACLSCHAKVAAEFHPPNEKHAVCRSCHQPHKPKSVAIAACAGCHQDKALVATKWPIGSPHEKQCNLCHQQHDVHVKVACASCHVKEGTSAMGGKHQCKQCHAPHTAPPGFGVAWWTRCNQCHAAKVESAKLRGPVHSSCQNCHKPHQFGVPTCTSCHTDITTKGLHSTVKHAASCTSCHDPHVKSEPLRAQCLKCHTDRVNHEPNAVKCQSCHMFK